MEPKNLIFYVWRSVDNSVYKTIDSFKNGNILTNELFEKITNLINVQIKNNIHEELYEKINKY